MAEKQPKELPTPPTVLNFKCPVCKADDRLGEWLSKKVKKRGLMREDLFWFPSKIEAVVRDRAKDAKVPIGAKLPSVILFVDMCRQCGNFYVPRAEIGEVMKTPAIRPPGPHGPISLS